ncbi:Cyclic di-GMP phosphodiesterase Gmr [compost metagenome]
MPMNASRRSATATILATAFFATVAISLGGLATNVIVTMRASADTIDNERSVEAAGAALNSTKDKLASVTRDNAQWDDAYAASNDGSLATWAYENWGNVSSSYELYDGAVVIGSDGRTVLSTRHGEKVDPARSFGEAFSLQTKMAATYPQSPIVNFVRTPDGVKLLSSQAIQPHSTKDAHGPFAVLSFLKDIDAEELASIEKHYMLKGLELHLEQHAEDTKLSVPMRDVAGKTVAHIAWASLNPGTRVLKEVSGQINAAVIILGIFLVTVILAGGAESRRMAKLARRAQHDATHDGLSGLLNRAGLIERLGMELDAGLPVTLHLLDLDGFKGVNDAWGHQIGDKLIKEVSRSLVACHPEVLHAARLGGDEFAVVQRGPTTSDDFANILLKVFEAVYEIDGRTVEVGASLGHVDSDGVTDPFELLRRADIALYRAKDDGKGRAVAYHCELDKERERLLELEDDLRKALMAGGVTVVYQPLVSAATGKLNGVEALARWITERGPISPEIFIPLAERSGLIDQLGMHVLLQSIRNAREWPDLKLSVNVSPIQLCNPSFASSITRLLEEEDFDPARLTLEITEGVLMSNPDQAQRAIDDLRKTGVRFSLDDFGCGYASIGALRQFGFDSMKIDRSLVWAADKEGKGQDVLKATIALATALSIPVTAEGIETPTQANILREAGCDQLQGYMVGRPMPAEEIGKLRLAA